MRRLPLFYARLRFFGRGFNRIIRLPLQRVYRKVSVLGNIIKILLLLYRVIECGDDLCALYCELRALVGVVN